MVSQECYKTGDTLGIVTRRFDSQMLVTEQDSNSLAKAFYHSLASSIFNVASTRGLGTHKWLLHCVRWF